MREDIESSSPARRRPASVWIAIAALSVVLAVQVTLAVRFARSGELGWGMYAFAGLLWALLIGGIARGTRLAWLWGRYLPLVLGVVMLAAIVAGAVRHELTWETIAWSVGGIALPLFVAGLALGRPSAFAFFDLVCPDCSARTGLGADLLFRQARCRRCDHVW